MTQNFVVYRSSAGSGKTYTLVRDYLALALGNPSPGRYRKILAITFTNKAAEEMKSRVLKALADIADGRANELVDFLTQTCQENDSVIVERAHATLKQMLHNYSDLAICTIDKFMHQLVRTFSRDLLLSQDFNVESDTTPILEEAVGRIIDRVGSDALTTRVLVEWVDSQIENNSSWQIESELVKTGKSKINLHSEPFLERLEDFLPENVGELRKAIDEYCSRFESTIIEHAQKAMKAIRDAHLGPDSFHHKSSGIYSYILKIAEGEFNKVAGTRARLAIDEGKFENNNASAQEKSALAHIVPEITEHLRAIDNFRDEEQDQYLVLADLRKHLFQLVLLNELHLTLENIKDEKDLIFIDDFHRKISNVVRNEPAPFIYERTGQRFLDILIDEFQDTSKIQWQNFLPLITDTLSKGGRALVVGDGKQAIYRWRGGEVEQFDQLPNISNSEGDPVKNEMRRLLNDQYKPEKLEKNWRSLGHIVDFNNELYSVLKDHIPSQLQSVYNDVEQISHRHKSGLVTIDFLEFKNKEEGLELYLSRIEDSIIECLLDGYDQRDICVITRNNKEGQAVVQALNGKTVDGRLLNFISNDSLLIDHNPTVKWAIATLQYLSDPTHKGYALNALIRSVNLLKGEGNLHQYLRRFTSKKKGKLETIKLSGFFKDEGLKWNPDSLLALNLFDLVTALSRMVREKGQLETAHWSFFRQKVAQFSSEHGNDLAAFLRWWHDNAERFSLSIPEESNAIRTMSIHKSKGLQFPVVILPFCDWQFKQRNSTYWAETPESLTDCLREPLPEVFMSGFSKDLKNTGLGKQVEEENARIFLDNLNLLYVATTRPQERLYLFSRNQKMSEEVNSIAQLLTEYATQKNWTNFPIKIGSQGDRLQYFPDGKIPQPQSFKAIDLPISGNTGWFNKIRINLEAGEIIKGGIELTSRALGNLVHKMLSNIHTKADLKPTIRKFIASGELPPQLLQTVSTQLEEVVMGSGTESWFQKHDKILIEYPIISADGSMVRPDRIVINGNEATVIDYKTGTPQPAHQSQIKHYGELIGSMGYQCVLQLYYLESGHLETVNNNAQTSLF